MITAYLTFLYKNVKDVIVNINRRCARIKTGQNGFDKNCLCFIASFKCFNVHGQFLILVKSLTL